MGRTNAEVAELLLEYADLFAMNGGDDIRVRSYRKAAESIAAHPGDLAAIDVRTLPDVGEAIAKKVEEALRRGTFRQLEDLRARTPAGARNLLAVPGLGPRRALRLHTELGVDSPRALAAAIEQGRLNGMRGFGPRTRQSLLDAIAAL
ncbi:helix-hairpin-helix domain-containing protein [Thermomonospora cellulosilytica]|uniref:DNA polymerase (Family 10) n=1 Tax=Thermomonospora cellulosilytica TaxID=1411118 RepID=A0A7W3N4Y9_9ACTN|nr:helix-hairpin-helix domain-containing protein [Thermomonospora cellulosilytica]MBA9007563.1 DNA polymerase (family 10) [Thermomonospora cellulosilytica]